MEKYMQAMHLDSDTFNTVLPMLDKLKAEILAYYEENIQAAYIMDAAKKLVEYAEKTWGDTSPLFLDDKEAVFPIESGLDALAATWIAVYLHSKKKFNQALKYFEAVQHYNEQHSKTTEQQDKVFLDIAASVCYAELGELKKSADLLAKVAPYFDKQTTIK